MDGFIAFLCYVFLFAAIILGILIFGFKKKNLKKWLYYSLIGTVSLFIIYQFIPSSDTGSKASKSHFNEVIKIKSKASDTSGYDTDKNGNFVLKGVALKNTKITLKDDLDDDYPVKTKKLKAGEGFQYRFHVKADDSININLHADYKGKDLEKDIDIWSQAEESSTKKTKKEAKKDTSKDSKSTSSESKKEPTSSKKKSSSSEKESSSKESKQKPKKTKKLSKKAKMNKQIATQLEQYQGLAMGTLDDDLNPTDNGTPHEEYNFSLLIDKIDYTKKDDSVDVYFTPGYDKLSKKQRKILGTSTIRLVRGILAEVDENEEPDMLYFMFMKKDRYTGVSDYLGRSKMSDPLKTTLK